MWMNSEGPVEMRKHVSHPVAKRFLALLFYPFPSQKSSFLRIIRRADVEQIDR